MSRRIDIELTSDRGDGTWTWRAAGAQKPRGTVESSLVPDGSKVGDVLRAQADMDIEGVTITSLGSTQTRVRTEPERIEIVGSGRRDDEQLVTTQLAPKGRGGDRDRRPRRDGDRPGGDRPDRDRRPRPGGDRPGGERPGGDRPRGDRPDGDRRPRRDGERSEGGDRRGPRRPAPPALPERPKAKRLRPGRAHRKAVLADLPAEQQPIAEEVLRGGIPAVRQAIEAQNEKRAADGEAPINSAELLKLAESLLPRLRTAEWRDRAEAALADGDQLDLRDLRSVVVASDAAARDDETRALASQLRTTLDERVVAEQALWLEDLQLALDTGRIVRALRVSSRPPKAGTMLSPELRLALTGGANAALTEEATPDRWAAVLDAIAFSPVRTEVAPVSQPAVPSEELLTVIRKYASRIPKVAVAFGLEGTKAARPSGRALRPPKPPKRSGAVPVPNRPEVTGLAAPVVEAAPTEAAAPAEPELVAEDAPVVEAQAAPAPEVETGAAPEVEAGAAPEVEVEAAPVVEAEAAPERTDDLPAPADAEPTEAVAATDAYDEAPTPEVADAAVEEAVDAAPDGDAPTEA